MKNKKMDIKTAIKNAQAFGESLSQSDSPSIMLEAIYKSIENGEEKRDEIMRSLYDLREKGEIEFDKQNDSLIHLLPAFNRGN